MSIEKKLIRKMSRICKKLKFLEFAWRKTNEIDLKREKSAFFFSRLFLCPKTAKFIRFFSLFLRDFTGFFLHRQFLQRPLHIKKITARQDECVSETVVFNSNFIEFMLAFLDINQTDCGCDEPCPSVDRFVKLYIYRTYVPY